MKTIPLWAFLRPSAKFGAFSILGAVIRATKATSKSIANICDKACACGTVYQLMKGPPVWKSWQLGTGRVALLAAALVAPGASQGQGTVNWSWPRVYDQECTLTESFAPTPPRGVYILNQSPLGQSFTPTLSQVGFLQVALLPQGGQIGALSVNVREESITGPIVGSLGPILPAYAYSPTYRSLQFDFPSPVSVVPGQRYVFEIVQHGTGAALITCYHANELDYAGGTAIWSGREVPGVDLWFREGVLVPEPTSVLLLLLGGTVLAGWRWCRRRA